MASKILRALRAQECTTTPLLEILDPPLLYLLLHPILIQRITCTLDVYPLQVSESRPIHVTIGESVIQCSSESSWPGAFYECSIPGDLVSTSDDETDIKVTFDTLEKSLSLKRGWLVMGLKLITTTMTWSVP